MAVMKNPPENKKAVTLSDDGLDIDRCLPMPSSAPEQKNAKNAKDDDEQRGHTFGGERCRELGRRFRVT
jgi:hypothetical protein